ncbi:flagellar hook-associated protein [Enterobacteriaceae bacterium H16N7]|nr:flagellar hook-associated protein [Dryocola clanedunensis]
MQVGLHTSTLSSAGGLSPSSTVKPQGVALPARKDTVSASEYPASPLITTRPQRYSVQLNDQLTTIQQADSYLGNLEQKLLDYRHASLSGGRRGRESTQAQQQASDIQVLLDKRSKLSGGSVDRQLAPVLQGKAQVSFRAPELAPLLDDDARPETLLFSVSDGRKTQLSAVSATEDTDSRQFVSQLGNALRRLDIRTQKGRDGTTFTTQESNWSQLTRSFSVTGEGKQFSAGGKTKLALEAEPAQADLLVQGLATGSWSGAQGAVQGTLNQLSDQRQQLAAQQEKARQLIDGMSRFPETQSAVQASAVLSTSLDGASHNYDVLAQAVNGQANLSKLTVRSLLR